MPTAEDVASAQDAVSQRAEETGLLSSAGLVSGTLEVEVLLADPATTRQVHELVRPWLSPDFVLLTAALVPLQGQ